jgi:hypothetical protein
MNFRDVADKSMKILQCPGRNLAVVWCALLVLVVPLQASAQTLTHRYSFFSEPNGSTTLTDTVASANGSVQGAATITGGQLVLNGSSGNYGKLPAGLMTGDTAVTIEAWADYGALPANCYLYSLGNTDGSGAGEDYIFCAPQAARITISGVDPGYNAEQNATCTTWSGRTGLHIVAIYNPPAGYLAVYTNGVLAGVNNSETVPLSSVANVFSYLGRSLYTADPYAPIKVDEFRIWNGALNGLQAAADYLAGPTVTNASPGTVTNLQLQVVSQMAQGGKQNATVSARTTLIAYPVDITRSCNYSSGDTNVLTVNPTNGLITAVGPGTNVIITQYAGIMATQTIVVVPQPSVLTHRYSFFSEPSGSLTATDSIAAANGTLKGGALITGGQLLLNGTNGTYVSLPAGLINNNYTGVTVETWASFAPTLPVSFLFGFGNTNGTFGTNYLFCTAQLGRAAITGTTYFGEQGITTGGWAGQTNLHIVAVFEPPAGYISIYTNGVLAGIDTAVTTPLSAVNDVYSFIGRSLYSGDSYLPASLSEFRIYNGPLSAPQIALDAATGPSQIVTNTGALESIQLTVPSPLAAGATQPARVTGNFANVSNVNLFAYGSPTVSTDNTNVLTVTSSGLITAITPGATANIIASYGGLSVTQAVTVAGFATNQFSFESFNDGFWTIVNQGNNEPLTATYVGATQEAFTYGAEEQQFQVLYNLPNGTFRLSQRSSVHCLGVQNNSAVPGAAALLSIFYTGSSAQQWYLVSAGGGYYRIFNAASNLVLQTDNGNPAKVTLAPPSTSPFQLWQFNYQTHFPKKGTEGYESYYAKFESSWAYNYNDNHDGETLPAQFDFVPMVDTASWEPLSDLQARDASWLNSPLAAYLLTYNEPDNASQSDIPVTQVINNWPALQALNVPLISPATQNTQDAWENSFFSLIASNNYRVDYTAVHEYVPPNAPSLISDLYSAYIAYGRPVWLTEFSPVDWSGCQCWSEDDDYNFLAEFMWQAEGLSWFRRYSVFEFSNTNPDSPWVDNGFTGSIFLADGQTLSPYGELYATWDGDLTLHGQIPYIIHNLGTSFRLTATNGISTPLASSIYTRNATTEWALLASPDDNWYIISLNDGRRLGNTNGVVGLAPFGSTGTNVEWTFTGPDSSGYYFIGDVAGTINLSGSGTAPAIVFNTVSSSTQNNNTRWRLVKPYQAVAILPATPPAAITAKPGDKNVALSWSGSNSVFNVYRSPVSGGPYTLIAATLTNTNFTDTTVTNGISYFYVVTGLNVLAQESIDSAEVSALPVSLSQPQLNVAPVNNMIQFGWPPDHTGWRLLINTNGLVDTNAWMTVSNSATTNQIWLPFNPAQNNAFFRLVYP